jgi:YVTN family beta-propeller protein
VLRSFELGGEGGWDYLTFDAQGRRLFVTRGTHVAVLDADSGKVVGDVPDTAGVHGVVLVPELGRGFTSNGKDDTSTVFDLKTLAKLATVKTGQRPDALLYDPATKRVFVFDAKSQDATAIDAATNAVVGTLALGGKPESGVSDGAGTVYVNLEDTSEVVAFDPKELKVKARFALAPGAEPTGMALDPRSHRIFVGCGNEKLIVLDAGSGKVVASLPIGAGVDAVAFDAGTSCAFASNGDGTLTVVHEDDPATFRVLENAPTARGARTLALDAQAHVVYLATAKFEPVAEAAGGKHERPRPVPGSFTILVVGK